MESLLEKIYQLDKKLNGLYKIENYEEQTKFIIKVAPIYSSLMSESRDLKDKISIELLLEINENKNKYLLKRKERLESQIFQE